MFLLVPARPGSPGQMAVKWLCVRAHVRVCIVSIVKDAWCDCNLQWLLQYWQN